MSNSVVGPGDIIAGRYRIERLLGQGGMGSVYEAVQLSLGRRVALKLLVDAQLEHALPAAPQSAVLAARFEREAVALARLTDPHTVRLFDFGTDERRRPFLVMELLQGCDLASDLARNGVLRWDQALQVSQQVLASLAEAHAAGIIHRDIKPANLFLCAGPEWPLVRVLDFGIAAAAEGDRAARKLTLTGTVLGSAAYMSPEQAQGQEAGPASDLYSLGVVLFELLTGSTPFQGRTFTAQLLAKVMERAPALRDVRPELDLPDGVQALVTELLERAAAERPPSAQAVAERMTALLEGRTLPALVRAVDAAPTASQALAPPSTEPMRMPPTLDNWWPPPKTAPHALARPVAPRRRLALAASVLLVSVGVLGWQFRPSPHFDGGAPAPETASASPVLTSNGALPPGALVERRAEEVLGSAVDAAPAPSASERAVPRPAATKALVGPSPLARTEARRSAPPHAKAPPADPMQLPAPAAPVAPAAQPPALWSPSPSEAAAPPESWGEMTPTQRDDMSAALQERRLFARSRAIREYRDGLIENAELAARLREIDREFGAPPRWSAR